MPYRQAISFREVPIERLREYCDARGITMAMVIESLVDHYLNKVGHPEMTREEARARIDARRPPRTKTPAGGIFTF